MCFSCHCSIRDRIRTDWIEKNLSTYSLLWRVRWILLLHTYISGFTPSRTKIVFSSWRNRQWELDRCFMSDGHARQNAHSKSSFSLTVYSIKKSCDSVGSTEPQIHDKFRIWNIDVFVSQEIAPLSASFNNCVDNSFRSLYRGCNVPLIKYIYLHHTFPYYNLQTLEHKYRCCSWFGFLFPRCTI